MKYTLLLALCFAFLVSCDFSSSVDETEQQEEIDYTEQNEADIVAYIVANNLNAIRSDSGLYYLIEEEGTGNKPTSTSNVTVAYKGSFLNGTVFNESGTNGISFSLDQVIAGWTEGITYFNEGGSGILLIPAHLGYGNIDYPSIPAGSVLIFDINLISVN